MALVEKLLYGYDNMTGEADRWCEKPVNPTAACTSLFSVFLLLMSGKQNTRGTEPQLRKALKVYEKGPLSILHLTVGLLVTRSAAWPMTKLEIK